MNPQVPPSCGPVEAVVPTALGFEDDPALEAPVYFRLPPTGQSHRNDLKLPYGFLSALAAEISGAHSCCYGPGLSVQISWKRDSEELQYRRRNIHNCRLLVRDLTVREQHARNESRINTMVAAPGLKIVFENLSCDLPHN